MWYISKILGHLLLKHRFQTLSNPYVRDPPPPTGSPSGAYSVCIQQSWALHPRCNTAAWNVAPSTSPASCCLAFSWTYIVSLRLWQGVGGWRSSLLCPQSESEAGVGRVLVLSCPGRGLWRLEGPHRHSERDDLQRQQWWILFYTNVWAGDGGRHPLGNKVPPPRSLHICAKPCLFMRVQVVLSPCASGMFISSRSRLTDMLNGSNVSPLTHID